MSIDDSEAKRSIAAFEQASVKPELIRGPGRPRSDLQIELTGSLS